MKQSDREELKELLDGFRALQRKLGDFSGRLEEELSGLTEREQYGPAGEALEDEIGVLEDSVDIMDEALVQINDLV